MMAKLDMDQIRKDYKESKETSSQGDFWSAKEGENLIRVMPPWKEGVRLFYMKTYHHWIQRQPICCQRKMFEQRCYICEKVQELRATKDLADTKKARDLYARKDVYLNIVDLSDKSSGVQIFRCPNKVFVGIMAYVNDEKDWGDITDPDTGYDIIVDRTGEGLDTEYPSVRARKSATPIEDKKWLKQLTDLDQFSIVEDYEDQRSLYGHLFGEGPPPEDQPAQATAKIKDDEFDNPIEKDSGAEPVTFKTAWCTQFNNFGKYDEDKKECKSCTIGDKCKIATKVKGETTPQKAEDLKKQMKEAAE